MIVRDLEQFCFSIIKQIKYICRIFICIPDDLTTDTDKFPLDEFLQDDPRMALNSATAAMKAIPAGSPDYLRAQDIAMVSKTELKKDKKGNRDRD